MVESKRFAFFKKSKTKGNSDHAREDEAGGGNTGTRKSYNPVTLIRRMMGKQRTPRQSDQPAPPSQQDPTITDVGHTESEQTGAESPAVVITVDTSQLNEMGREVSLISDIRKGRDRGPGGRKRPSSHISLGNRVSCDMDSAHSPSGSTGQCEGSNLELEIENSLAIDRSPSDKSYMNDRSPMCDKSRERSLVISELTDKLGERAQAPNLASSQCNYLGV